MQYILYAIEKVTGGFIFNMQRPSDLGGLSFTATWPSVFSRFAVPYPLNTSKLMVIVRNLSRYCKGKNADRQGVVQFGQSTSGAVTFTGGLWSYSFSATVGISSSPKNLSELITELPQPIRSKIEKVHNALMMLPSSGEGSETQYISALDSILGE